MFDSTTPSGYLVAWIGQCAGIGAIVLIVIAFFGIVFGSSWLFIVIADDIKNDVAAFNDIVETQKHCDRAMLVKRFRDILKHYLNAKQ